MRFALFFILSALILQSCISVPSPLRAPSSASGVQAGNRAMFVEDPKMAIRVRWDLIEQEKTEIFAHFHLWDGSGVGRYSLIKLCEKAKSGVRVRLVVDGLSMLWTSVFTEAAFVQVLQESCKSDSGQAMEIRFWNPVDTRFVGTFLKEKNLRRNHDKILYLADQQLAYEGDRNWQNVNFREDPKKPGYTYLSSDAVVGGPAVADVKAYLEKVWSVATPAKPLLVRKEDKEIRVPQQRGPDRIRYSKLRYDEYFQDDYLKVRANYESMTSEVRALAPVDNAAYDWRQNLKPVSSARFIHFNPDLRLTDDDSMNIELLNLLNSAQSKVVISTPFLRMPDRFFDVIKALRARGVSIELITCPATSRLIPQFYQFQNHDIRRLKAIGVNVMQSSGEDDLHAKTIIVDGRSVFLGTHNFNMRSTFLDLESGFIFDDPAVAQLMTDFVLNQSEPYKRKRALSHYLLAPVLHPLLKWPFLEKQF